MNIPKTVAYITLKSRKPVENKKEPEFCTIGGFGVVDGDQTIYFDWQNFSGYKDFDEEGHFVISWDLNTFDEEHFIESNPELTEFPGWAKLTSLPLYEVFYEAGDDEDQQRIQMDLVEFSIADTAFEENPKTYSFTEEQVHDYNDFIRREEVKDLKKREIVAQRIQVGGRV